VAPTPGGWQAPDFAALAERVVPSVVSVFNTDVQEPGEGRRDMPRDPFHFFFGEPDGDAQPRVRTSSGSGFFIAASGEVLTNNHVVEDADRIEIELDDGTRYQVEVVGRDPETDLALLKVQDREREFPALALGRSDGVRVGEWVMAVGNPLNMDHTVTVGVVSAMGRVLGLSEDRSFENFIQTDAAINLGNSGGPLVNLRGEVIGINTAINIRGQNLGFAVPVNTASRILEQLRESGTVVRGYLGVMVRDIDQRRQEAFSLPTRKGAFVEDVVPGHAGDTAGLKPGDVVLSVDGVELSTTRELIDEVSARRPGTSVRLEVLRDGKRITLKAELEERGRAEESAEEGGQEEVAEGDSAERAGVSVAAITPRVRQAFGIPDGVGGVVITRVAPMSPAGEEGLRRGDVILEVNGATVAEPDEVLEAVRRVEVGGYLRLYVLRPMSEQSFFAILKLAK
jgi:serine protease Do